MHQKYTYLQPFFYQKGILCKFKHKWISKDRLNWNSIDFLPEYGAPSLFTRKTPASSLVAEQRSRTRNTQGRAQTSKLQNKTKERKNGNGANGNRISRIRRSTELTLAFWLKGSSKGK